MLEYEDVFKVVHTVLHTSQQLLKKQIDITVGHTGRRSKRLTARYECCVAVADIGDSFLIPFLVCQQMKSNPCTNVSIRNEKRMVRVSIVFACAEWFVIVFTCFVDNISMGSKVKAVDQVFITDH